MNPTQNSVFVKSKCAGKCEPSPPSTLNENMFHHTFSQYMGIIIILIMNKYIGTVSHLLPLGHSCQMIGRQ